MFEGFEPIRIDTGEATISGVRGGHGPAVLLLHGYPQTHVTWHKIAPRLAADFTVVATDLRGYGDSSKPRGGPALYSKRQMARDQAAVMERLGLATFAVVGHDRGARVAHRLALDYGDRVTKLAVLDIVPTVDLFAAFGDAEVVRSFWYWMFLGTHEPIPERLIGSNVEFLTAVLFGQEPPGTFTEAARAEYRRCFGDPESIHAACEDYRAGGSIDLADDRVDLPRKLACPVLALWGLTGNVHRHFDVLGLWRARAHDIRGRALPGGHYLAEERPDETLAELTTFLRG